MTRKTRGLAMLDMMIPRGVMLRCNDKATDDQPDIPNIDDVRFALHLISSEVSYRIAMERYPIYIQNVHLVAAAIGAHVMNPHVRSNGGMVDKAIGFAIVSLTPIEARCYLRPQFREAYEVVDGKRVVTIDTTIPPPEPLLRAACATDGCQSCKIIIVP